MAGLVLAGLYITILAGAFFPIQLLNPAWQLKIGSALINASPFPLLGLALLHLGPIIDPLLASRQRLGARLALVAACGFLLLLPLLSLAAVRDQQQRTANESSMISRASRNLQALRQVVASATSTSELGDRLLALDGPVLNEANKALPLPTIKAQVNSLLDQAAAQVRRQEQSQPPRSPLTLLPELLRNGVACVLLALGVAGLAQRPGHKLSLLQELQLAWHRLGTRRGLQRRLARPGADPDYFRKISEKSEPKTRQPGKKT